MPLWRPYGALSKAKEAYGSLLRCMRGTGLAPAPGHAVPQARVALHPPARPPELTLRANVPAERVQICRATSSRTDSGTSIKCLHLQPRSSPRIAHRCRPASSWQDCQVGILAGRLCLKHLRASCGSRALKLAHHLHFFAPTCPTCLHLFWAVGCEGTCAGAHEGDGHISVISEHACGVTHCEHAASARQV